MSRNSARPDDDFSQGAIQPASAGGSSGGGWALPALLAALVAVVGTFGWLRQKDQQGLDSSPAGATGTANWTPAPRPTGPTVSLTIDFGNGARREFAALPWRPGATIADVMHAAREFRPGISYEQQNEGAEAFVSAVEGVGSEAAGGRYWQILVNDQPINDSMGVHALESGDRILWLFTTDGQSQ